MKLSKKYGVNPSISVCFFCGEDKGLVLGGRQTKDAELPKKAIYDFEPCDACKKLQEDGVMLIGIRNDIPPTRAEDIIKSGHYIVITDEGMKKLDPNYDLSQRWTLVPEMLLQMFDRASKAEETPASTPIEPIKPREA